MNTYLISPTPKLTKSIDFYDRLGFRIEMSDSGALVSDGQAFLEINTQRYTRAGIVICRDNWDDVISALSDKYPYAITDDGYVLSDPSGTWVYLNHGPTKYQLNPQDKSFSLLGNYVGLSLEVLSIENALEFYSLLGFEKSSGSAEQGWVSLKNSDGVAISLMKPLVCPHLFYNPSLTYFNGGNNMEVIDKIRKAEIPITEEITHFNKDGLVDNVILRDPGGFGFFIFND